MQVPTKAPARNSKKSAKTAPRSTGQENARRLRMRYGLAEGANGFPVREADSDVERIIEILQGNKVLKSGIGSDAHADRLGSQCRTSAATL